VEVNLIFTYINSISRIFLCVFTYANAGLLNVKSSAYLGLETIF